MEDEYYCDEWIYLSPEERQEYQLQLNKFYRELLDILPINRAID